MAGNAVQRWFFYPLLGRHVEGDEITPRPEDVLWVKAKDVAELERVIEENSSKHSDTIDGLHRQLDAKNVRIGLLDDDVMRLNGVIAARDAEIKRLKEYEWMYKDLQS